MQRRTFAAQSSMAALAAALRLPTLPHDMDTITHKRLLPHGLWPGMEVALIAPSGPVSDEHLARVQSNMAYWGLKGVEGKALRSQNGFLAGTDAQRLADFHWAFEDTRIGAVWCVRGGYGATRILRDIDYKLIRRNPKALIGYSDITALHLSIHYKTGLVTFHGPVAGGDHPAQTQQWFRSVLLDGNARTEITPLVPVALEGADTLPPEEDLPHTIVPGRATGPLIGGNICLIAAMCGTGFLPDFSGKIVFLEDIDEAPYRIDRMLTQILQSTDLRKAAGIALGVFSGCRPKGTSSSFTLLETLRERLGGLGIPVAYGLPFGHVSLNATLPLGIRAELDATAVKLTLLERAIL